MKRDDASGARGVHRTARRTPAQVDGSGRERRPRRFRDGVEFRLAADRREHLAERSPLDVAVRRRRHAFGRPAVQHGRADEPDAKRARVRRRVGEDEQPLEPRPVEPQQLPARRRRGEQTPAAEDGVHERQVGRVRLRGGE